ncbi:MAG TPA: HAMP domain-containing sensor histidine kinase [Kofleriaceae bacterium]|nr:HAMP domain-containing sensor histidine kinase [Kofleriaceae bacterium]
MTASLHGARAAAPAWPRRFRSLASRLVALGIGQLVLLALTAVGIFIAEGPHDVANPADKLPPGTVARLEGLVDSPAALGEALDELRGHRVELSLYDGAHQLIASNVDPPLAIPARAHHGGDEGAGPPRPIRRLLARHRLVLGFDVHGDRGVLVARGVHGDPPGLTGPLLVLIGGFVILVLGALSTARWIVRPIERLSRTARALGSGDLAARSRLDRADEIGELGHRFDEMAERIAGLLVTEKELLANVAHELRTPLTRIGVALDLASEGDAEAARASLAEIAVDVSELETIVDDILTAMRFELTPGNGAGQLPLRRAVVAAGEVAAAAADRLRARHAGRPLELTIAGELPEIHVDPVLLRRVIDNLLENAHKYTPDPAAPITLEVSVTRDDRDVVFEIRDRGVGISAEDLPRIGTAFFRGERSRSRETGGVGLGFTLARRIVEAHGGTIGITSTPNVGTTVRVTVPADADDADGAASAADAAGSARRAPGATRRP